MSKKVLLDNTGVVVTKRSTPVVSKKATDKKPVQENIASTITTDFIRELKDELVQELGRILGNLKVALPKNTEEQRDSSNQSGIVIEPIKIDESVVVTDVAIGQVEKKFEALTETQTTKDQHVSDAINKLRSLKKGN